MARQNSGRSNGSRLPIAGALATGVKEMPRNASWLVGKALTPIAGPRGKVEDVGKDAADKVRSTGSASEMRYPGLVTPLKSASSARMPRQMMRRPPRSDRCPPRARRNG